MAAQPSTFATLLRRSKFASYDPAIAQIYTAPPAHAHRGDFGFKRPLPRLARKKSPAVFVSRVDTPEYQTEWEDATSQNKFVQRFEELGAPKPRTSRYVEKRGPNALDWIVDSEFDREGMRRRQAMKPEDELPSAKDAVPAYHELSLSEFQTFKEKSRELRPEFYRYLEEVRLARNQTLQERHTRLREDYMTHFASPPKPSLASETPSDIEHEPTSFYTAAQALADDSEGDASHILRAQYSTVHRGFLGQKAKNKLLAHGTETGSLPIAPLPHAHAGLTYTHSSPLQSVLLSPPRSAHVVVEHNFGGHSIAEPPEEYYKTNRANSRGGRQNGSSGFTPPNRYSYSALFGGGSHVAELDPSRVLSQSSGLSAEKEDRVEAFNWFYGAKSRVGPPAALVEGRKGRSQGKTFKIKSTKLLDAPNVVSTGAHASSTPSSASKRGNIMTPQVNGTVLLEAEPWSTEIKKIANAHPLGTPAYVGAVENAGWKSNTNILAESPVRSRREYVPPPLTKKRMEELEATLNSLLTETSPP